MQPFDSIITHFFHQMKRKRRSKIQNQKLQGSWPSWTIGGVLVLILIFMFPEGRWSQFADMKEGSVSTRRIVAPFRFEILKTRDELQRDRDLAIQKVYPVFLQENQRTRETLQDMDRFFQKVRDIRRDISQNPGSFQTLHDSLYAQYAISVSDTSFRKRLLNPSGDVTLPTLSEFQNQMVRILRDLMSIGILDVEKQRFKMPDQRMIIKGEDSEEQTGFDTFYDLSEARAKAIEMLSSVYGDENLLAQMGFGVANYFLKSTLVYDEETHQQRVESAKARVPLSSGFVIEDEMIVDKNERITYEIRKKLESLAAAMSEKGMRQGGFRRLFPVLGKIGLILMLFFVFVVFILQEKPEILRETKSILLVALIILFVSILTVGVRRLNLTEYLVPAAIGSMLLAILFDKRLGYVSTSIISVLVGALWGNAFNLTVISFFVGVIGVMAISRVRDRRQLVQAIFLLAGAYIIAITGMGLLNFLPIREIIKQWPFGAAAGLMMPIIAYGLVPLIESTFDITTDFSLLELSNLNHPLLKRLSVQSPGTYHHSIIVGNLAEAGAYSVNANSLLARVGSYYHDVGKIDKAEYFVENQVRKENPHEKLTPRMSALILMNHVKKGLEIAEKYRLPSSIRDIIVQHQGTTIMSFFYQKALEKDVTGEVREEDYRYPGPLPQTKEAAVVMLADTVEAASRSLKDPTHSRLKGLIVELVDERFQEGQLDESPLTLRDLQKIKESFLTILAGTFHTRVEYPDKDDAKSTENSSPKNGNADTD